MSSIQESKHPVDICSSVSPWEIAQDEAITQDHPILILATLRRLEVICAYATEKELNDQAKELARNMAGIQTPGGLPCELAANLEDSTWAKTIGMKLMAAALPLATTLREASILNSATSIPTCQQRKRTTL
jgi:hypothetical protein